MVCGIRVYEFIAQTQAGIISVHKMSNVYIFTMQQLIKRNNLTERLCKDFAQKIFNLLDSTEHNNRINTTIIMQISY